jgi:hypothetical protein
MILQEYVEVKINSRNFDYYKSLIPNTKNNKVYKINVNDLFYGSHTKIKVCCDICKSESYKPYRQYKLSFDKYNLYCCSPKCAQLKNKITNLERYGVINVFQSDIIKNKIIETNLLKYGVSYPSQSSHIRSKIINTLQKNYGVANPMYSKIIKKRLYDTCIIKYNSGSYLSSNEYINYRIKNGTKIPDFMKSDFKIYQDKVRYLTNKIKDTIFYDWDGYDFYDNEYIKCNLELNPSNGEYPTMDHKISIYYGFNNNIDINFMASSDNIVITKRFINSKKHTKSIFD